MKTTTAVHLIKVVMADLLSCRLLRNVALVRCTNNILAPPAAGLQSNAPSQAPNSELLSELSFIFRKSSGSCGLFFLTPPCLFSAYCSAAQLQASRMRRSCHTLCYNLAAHHSYSTALASPGSSQVFRQMVSHYRSRYSMHN